MAKKVKEKWLFVVHSCETNGATTSLVHLVRALKMMEDSPEIAIVLMSDGTMSGLFSDIGVGVFRLQTVSKNRILRFTNKLRNVLTLYQLRRVCFDVIIGNTCVSVPVVRNLATRGSQVSFWIHELEFGLCANLGPRWNNNFRHSDMLLSCGPAVTEFLNSVGKLHVEELGECVDFDDLGESSQLESSRQLIIGMVGTLNWRKGADFFLQVAYEISQSDLVDSVRFVWIGSPQSETDLIAFRQNITKMNLASIVTYECELANRKRIFDHIDVLFLSSFEDPNPLVVIEATWLGIPVISMEKSGGATYTTQLAGYKSCRYRNISDIVNLIRHYVDSPLPRASSRIVQDELRKRYSPQNVANRLLSLLGGR